MTMPYSCYMYRNSLLLSLLPLVLAPSSVYMGSWAGSVPYPHLTPPKAGAHLTIGGLLKCKSQIWPSEPILLLEPSITTATAYQDQRANVGGCWEAKGPVAQQAQYDSFQPYRLIILTLE